MPIYLLLIPIYIKTGRYDVGIYVMESFNLNRMYMSKNELILLNKIKIYFLNNEKYYLSYNEIQTLSNIICTYTMSEMSEEFDVSVKTIQRDIDYLSGVMMIPIYCQSGKYEGGVYIDDDYRWDKMYMTIEQISLLIKVREMVSDKLSDKEKKILTQIIDLYSMFKTSLKNI